MTLERLAFITVFVISRMIDSNRLDRTASRIGSNFAGFLALPDRAIGRFSAFELGVFSDGGYRPHKRKRRRRPFNHRTSRSQNEYEVNIIFATQATAGTRSGDRSDLFEGDAFGPWAAGAVRHDYV